MNTDCYIPRGSAGFGRRNPAVLRSVFTRRRLPRSTDALPDRKWKKRRSCAAAGERCLRNFKEDTVAQTISFWYNAIWYTGYIGVTAPFLRNYARFSQLRKAGGGCADLPCDCQKKVYDRTGVFCAKRSRPAAVSRRFSRTGGARDRRELAGVVSQPPRPAAVLRGAASQLFRLPGRGGCGDKKTRGEDRSGTRKSGALRTGDFRERTKMGKVRPRIGMPGGPPGTCPS